MNTDYFKQNSKILAVVALACAQLACEGDTASLSEVLCTENCGSTTTTTLSGTRYLDCSNLDPDKVYLRGTLQEGLGGRDAIIDPADPTRLCLGLPSAIVMDGQVSGAGRYLYEDSLTLYSMEPEPYDIEPDGDEVYPANPEANDTVLLNSTATGCGIRLLIVNPANNINYYSCPNNTINTDASVPYYSLGNGELLSVLDDGSMLIAEFNQLSIFGLAPTFTETPLHTGAVTASFLTAKLFSNPATLNPSVWVVMDDGTGTLQRLSIDLNTLVVVNDGNFAATPASVNERDYTSKLDGNGDLWQTGSDTTVVTDDVIIKRPILSSGTPASVVYTEADDDGSDPNFVKMHASDLFTGI